MEENPSMPRPSSVRWQILRRALLPPKQAEKQTQMVLENVSRKPMHGFNMIPFDMLVDFCTETSNPMKDFFESRGPTETCICYTLPVETSTKIVLFQRMENHINLNDFEMSSKHNVDNTGLVCSWPSEDVLAHFCLNHAEIFRSRRVLELGSGYGLAGLAIAAGTSACEVVISDGNPRVVDYISHNIAINVGTFGNTVVKPKLIHWDHEPESCLLNYFDIIVASDCTFFKEFHESLALTVKSMLKQTDTSQAIFLTPRRGHSLEMFLQKLNAVGLKYTLFENYDSDVWSRHLELRNGTDNSWPNYDEGHCYPLLVRITFHSSSEFHDISSLSTSGR